MQSGEIADLLGKNKNTIINWTRDFADFLSKEAAGKPKGSRREFSDADLYVLATIKDRYEYGLTTEEVQQALERGYRVTRLPEKPDPAIQAARDAVDIVPIQDVLLERKEKQSLELEIERLNLQQQREMERALAAYQATLDGLAADHEKEVTRLAAERDEARKEAKSERDQRREAELKAARVEEKLINAQESMQRLQQAQESIEQLKQQLGQYQAGNVELQNQLGYVQYLLEEEKKRKKGWF